MDAIQQLNKTVEDTCRLFEEFKKTNDDRLRAVERGDHGQAASLNQKLAKMEVDFASFAKLKTEIEVDMKMMRDRVEELEAKGTNPSRYGVGLTREEQEYSKAFGTWIRSRGQDMSAGAKMSELARTSLKALPSGVLVGTQADGGYGLPKEILTQIEKQELLFSPVRRLVKVVKVSTTDYQELLSTRGATSGWVGEGNPRGGTGTPQLRNRKPTFGTLYAYPKASEEALDDIAFNVEQWLADEVADEFALQEGAAVIRGNGVNRPTGLINTAPVTTDDRNPSPTRSAEAFEYILDQESPASIGMDNLITTVYALASAYRARGVWVMNSLTASVVRKLKDTTGQYLWQPSVQAGQPAQLLGYPVEIWEQMDDVGHGKFPVAFGDWQRAYILADRVGTRITRDEITVPGYVNFYVRRREGGIVKDNNAVKFVGLVEND